jgi:hypothetical protein
MSEAASIPQTVPPPPPAVVSRKIAARHSWRIRRRDHLKRKRWRLSKPLQGKLTELAVAVAAIVYLNRELLNLSSGALWLPAEWKLSVEIGVSIWATAIFSCTGLWVQVYLPRLENFVKGPKPTPVETRAYEQAKRVFNLRCMEWAIVFGAACLLTMLPYRLLRGYCILAWDSSFYKLEAQVAVHEYDSTARRSNVILNPLPQYPFINDDYTEIYVPFHFPPDEQRVLDAIAHRDPGMDPVSIELSKNPDVLIQWLNGRSCQWNMQLTTWPFLILHALIIGFGAVCGALIFKPFESFLDVLPRLFGK